MHLTLFFYNIVVHALLPLSLPYFLWRRIVSGKPLPDFGARLSARLPAPPPDNCFPIWFHAVSVGEVLAVAPLVEQVVRELPEATVFFSATTPTGLATARRVLDPRVTLFACPFDLPWAVSRLLRRIRPRWIVIAETELWPNILRQSQRRGIPVAIVNGRISDRAFPRYHRVRRLLAPFLRIPRHFLMQSERQSGRIRELGAPPDRVRVTGNMKFDSLRAAAADAALTGAIRRALGPGPTETILCGSTMNGEEKILAAVLKQVRRRRPAARLVVAPRHPERFQSAADTFVEHGFTVVRRTALDTAPPAGPVDVVILDSIGELASLFAMADVVFIGGTLVPTGGHNILEPAAAGCPIVVGPSMENFPEIMELFLARGGVLQTDGPAGLAEAIASLLEHSDRRADLGARALQALWDNQGATGRNFEVIFLPGRPEGQ